MSADRAMRDPAPGSAPSPHLLASAQSAQAPEPAQSAQAPEPARSALAPEPAQSAHPPQPASGPAAGTAAHADAGAWTVAVRGIGLLGPGLTGWPAACRIWQGEDPWPTQPTDVPAPHRLPATERRRAGTIVKASLVVADEALAAAGGAIAPQDLATVFTSSTGDPAICHQLCEALAAPQRVVSPTRFTNSVHNAAAGYWHIATQAMAASTSLAAFDGSAAAGLLEAAVQCHASGRPVLLVAADVPYPEPLHRLRPVTDVLAVALLLAPTTDGETAPCLHLSLQPDAPATACADARLEALRQGIPAARLLPLLQMLAAPGATAQPVDLDAWDGLALRVHGGTARA